MNYYNGLCRNVFGFDIKSENIKNMNERYGGVGLRVNNVIFTGGDDDPWNMVSMWVEMNEGNREYH